jgi:hypothetical protein
LEGKERIRIPEGIDNRLEGIDNLSPNWISEVGILDSERLLFV